MRNHEFPPRRCVGLWGGLHNVFFQIKTPWSKIPDLLDSVDWRSLQIQGTKSASDRQVES